MVMKQIVGLRCVLLVSFHTDPHKVWPPRLEPIHKIIANPRIATIHHRTEEELFPFGQAGLLSRSDRFGVLKWSIFNWTRTDIGRGRVPQKGSYIHSLTFTTCTTRIQPDLPKKIHHHHQLDDLTWPTGLGPSLKPPGFEIRSSRHCCLRGTIQGLGESGANFCLGGNRWFLWWRCVCVLLGIFCTYLKSIQTFKV